MPCSVYQNLSTCYDWPVEWQEPIRVKGNPKHTSGNTFSPLGIQNTEFGATSQTLLGYKRAHRPKNKTDVYLLRYCLNRSTTKDETCIIITDDHFLS